MCLEQPIANSNNSWHGLQWTWQYFFEIAILLKLKISLFDVDKKNVNVCCNQVKASNNFPVSYPVLDALRHITILHSQVGYLTSKRSWSIFSEHSFNPGIMSFTTISPLTKNTKLQLSEEHWLHIIHQVSMIYLLSISFCCSSDILDLCSFIFSAMMKNGLSHSLCVC